MPKPLLTILCPVYNEERTVPLFYNRIAPLFDSIATKYDVNLVFMDNGSKDRTHEIVVDICKKDPRVFTLVLSRNFGYQCSVECGLRNTHGDLFFVIDVDCEDPPEMIPEFLKQHEEGFDIVYGERLDREESMLMILARKLFYRLTRLLADEHFILDMAEFALVTAEVRDAILADNNSFPFIRASIGRIGFSAKNIPYKRQRRIAGETHYNFLGMAIFAIAGILSASTLPLRLAAYGFPFWLAAMTALCVAGPVWGAAWYLPAVLLLGFGFCGYTLTFVSIYLSRVYHNGLHRPNFVVSRRRSRFQPGRGAIAISEQSGAEAR